MPSEDEQEEWIIALVNRGIKKIEIILIAETVQVCELPPGYWDNVPELGDEEDAE